MSSGAIESLPRRFGQYVLLQPLGDGGMGQVTLAMTGQVGCERLCVVKRILPHLRADPAYLRRFRDEAELARRMSHGNLVETHAVGSVEGQPFIAQAFVDGCDLSELCARSGNGKRLIPTPVAVYIVGELARGLAYAHDFDGLNLVHRDINPPNVRLTFSGEVKLLDFGLARSDLRSSITEPGESWGKAAYMAPEQLTGGTVDRRADIYALGVLLWELLSGQLFGTVIRDGHAHYEAGPKSLLSAAPRLPPSVFNREVSPELDAVVRRTISRDPGDRLATATELRTALSSFIPAGYCPEQALGELVKLHFYSEMARAARDRMIAEARVLLAAPEVPPAAEEGTLRSAGAVAGDRRKRAIAGLVGGVLVAAAALTVVATRAPSSQDARNAGASHQAQTSEDVTGSRGVAPKAGPAEERSPAPVAEPPGLPASTKTTTLPSRTVPRPAAVPVTTPAAVPGPDEKADALSRAKKAFGTGDLAVALREAERAARLGAGADAYVIVGNVRYKQADYPAAEAAYGEAVRRDPSNQIAASRLARVRELMRDPDHP